MRENIQVLDHGYVSVIEAWGSDERIIEAARMSTDGAFRGWGPNFRCKFCGCLWRNNHDGTVSLLDARQRACEKCDNPPGGWSGAVEEVPGDEKLLKYLYTHKHMSPFEMAGLVLEVQAPIFVFREWHRHRTQSYNELSARYTPIPNVNYVPSVERLMMRAEKNKQASSTGRELTEPEARQVQNEIRHVYTVAEYVYQDALRVGTPKELARIVMPVGRYSCMRASANLRNWLQFLTLRMDSAAQWEIRQYANTVADIVEKFFPRTYGLFNATGPIITGDKSA